MKKRARTVLPALALLAWAGVALAADPAMGPPKPAPPPDTEEPTWLDSSHAYATDRAQDLASWMDSFFGDPQYDIERPESIVRLDLISNWDDIDGDKQRVRLRGKLFLPALSERLSLVFSDDDGDQLIEDDESSRSGVGLLFKLDEAERSRVDLTLGFHTIGVRPGVRYRNQGPIAERFGYRYTQELEWEDGEGFFTTGQVNLDHSPTDSRLLRWSNRAVYGEESDGVEWRTALSQRHRLRDEDKSHQLVVGYYAAVKGVTDPSYVKNYRVGVSLRRQMYREFLFVELEPAYNFRKREGQTRENAWSVSLRFELVLSRDLKHISLRKPLELSTAGENDADF